MNLRIGPWAVLIAGLTACAGGGSSQKSPDASLEDPADARPRADARGAIDAPGQPDAKGDAPGMKDAPTADAPRAADAAGAADAAQGGVGVTLSPATPTVSRGGSVTLTVTLASAAPAGGTGVSLESDSAAVIVPSSVTVMGAATGATFTASGVNVAASVKVRARLGAGTPSEITMRVVPALAGISPGNLNILGGKTGGYTVSLEAAAEGAVTVSLAAADPDLVGVPSTTIIPSGQASATFVVTGTKLGVSTITAAIGNASVSAQVRVFGLLFSEILYDLPGADDQREWIELYNGTSSPIDTAGMVIQVASTAGHFVDALELGGTVPAGGCVVVGGPMGNDGDAGPSFTYFVAGDFDTDLGNAGTSSGDAGDGIQLVSATGVIDNVIYGRNNDDLVLDEDGVPPAAPDIGDASENKSIQRTQIDVNGAWVTDSSPNPGDCSAIAK